MLMERPMETETALLGMEFSGVTLLFRMEHNAVFSEIAQRISRNQKANIEEGY
jgi:hypothetical protein